jgi:hypothetical protein
MTVMGGVGRVRVQAEAAFDQDSRAWGLSRRTALSIAALPMVIGLLVAAAHLYHPLYRFLTAEDSVLEWSQVILVLVSSGLLFLTAAILASHHERRWAVLFAIGALGAFFVAGEEISWGQRLFGIATPAEFLETNSQGETNLHNVRGALVAINFVTMIGAGFLTMSPVAVAAMRIRGVPIWPWLYRIVPPFALVIAFAIPFAYRAARFVTSRGTSGSFAEFVEFSLYFGLAAFAFLLHRRISAERPEPAPADTAPASVVPVQPVASGAPVRPAAPVAAPAAPSLQPTESAGATAGGTSGRP